MSTHKSKDEKLDIINKFFKSNMSISKFSKEIGIPSSTLSTWLRIYNASIKANSPENQALTPNFYNVTNLVKDTDQMVETKSKSLDIISATNSIKLNCNNFSLEFDVSILRKVLEVLND